MTVRGWIGFNFMTSRYSIFNQYPLYVVQVWSSLYIFTVVFSKISIDKYLKWPDLLWSLYPIFSKQIRWIGWRMTAMESFWICWRHFGMSSRSSCILQVLDRRWKMPNPQVPDVRCKVEGCWCVAVFRDVCGPIPSRLVISRYHVSWILKFSKPEGHFLRFYNSWNVSVWYVNRSSVIISAWKGLRSRVFAFRAYFAYFVWSQSMQNLHERQIETKLSAKPLIAWFEQMRLGSDRLLSGMLICFSEKITEEAWF